jgi:hypothetical protein
MITVLLSGLFTGLARALYRSERLSVLKLALIAYDHNITELHDQLGLAGALTVMVRCLQSTLTCFSIHWVEVNQMCQLIAMAYRCSDEVAVHSMEEVGTDLIIQLFSVLLRHEPSRERSSVVRLLIQRIAKLEVSFPKVKQSNRLLLFLEQMALLNDNDDVVSLDAFAILAGWTAHRESKVYVLESSRTFLECLIKCSKMKRSNTDTKHHIARVLQNLTTHSSNKSRMAEKGILDELVEIASSQQYHESTRAQAIQALKQLSVETKSKIFMVGFNGAAVVKALISSTDDAALRSHVVETLLSLTCYYTASPLANYPGVVDMLVDVADSGNDQAAEKAAQTLKRFATHISVSDKGHPAVFKAVLFSSGSPRWMVRRWMAMAFRDQSRLAGCSFLLVRSADALNQICDLAKDSNQDVRDAAVETILALAASQSNLKRLSSHKRTLNALVDTIHCGIEEMNCSSAVRNAILTILALLENRHARKKVARHKGIVGSLSRYGNCKDDDEELKNAALHGLVLLSPLMSSKALRVHPNDSAL